MRLDHIALRVPDRLATAKFYQEAFGYKVQAEFQIDFDDGSKAECIALEPSEKICSDAPWVTLPFIDFFDNDKKHWQELKYHMAPEIFISDGPPGSIVGDWVAKRNGVRNFKLLAVK